MIEYLRTTRKNLFLFMAGLKRRKHYEELLKKDFLTNRLAISEEKRFLTFTLIDFAEYVGIDPMIVIEGDLYLNEENKFDNLSTSNMITKMKNAMRMPKPLSKIGVNVTNCKDKKTR